MKKSLITLFTGLAALGVARAAVPPEIVEAHQHAFEAIRDFRNAVVPGPIVRFVESFPPIAAPREAVLRMAQVSPSATPPVAPPPPVDPGAISDWANNVAMSATRGVFGIFGDGKAIRKPVIVGGDAKNAAALDEDLNVMQRIIEKAAGSRDESKAMGIDVLSFTGGGLPRMFYLDGYGAMFLVKVKYPLLGPPRADEESRTNEPTNSEWERARQEVYGGRHDETRLAWRDAAASEPFDEQRVESLKSQIIDDLANATHIRNLKSDEWVTVVVLGTGRGNSLIRREVHSGGSSRSYASTEVRTANEAGGQTTMTLRAKKSDVDAFAKGKMKTEEFRKRVSVQVY